MKVLTKNGECPSLVMLRAFRLFGVLDGLLSRLAFVVKPIDIF